MKRLIITIEMLFIAITFLPLLNGQNVGIGTNSPEARFHMFSSGDVLTPGGLILLGRRSEFHLELDFNSLQVNRGFDEVPKTFYLQPNGGNTIVGGNMAVGTNSFVASLNVDGGPPISGTGKGDMIIGDVDGLHVRYDNNELLARNGDNPATLRLQSWGGDLSLALNDDGKVGIGNANPQAKLQITDGLDLNLNSGGHLILGGSFGYNLAFDHEQIMARNNGAIAPMFLQKSGGDILMIGNEAGTVGIGVTSSAFLPDGFLLAVDGKIISEEIRVELSGDWPDYVFESDYALMSLDELENQIKEKGHLPGIPSASLVESNGFELGDMQKRMMEKIEELTLYMIDANKKIKSLEQNLNALEVNK